MNIVENMKARNLISKASKVVWDIEELLEKLLKCFFKNKLMNFENKNLSERYDYLLGKIKEKYIELENHKDLPGFDYEERILKLKEFKANKIVELENIAIHENAFKGNKFEKCKRCDGTGGLDHYRHVRNGICFACEGNLVVMTSAFKKHMKKIEKVNDNDDLPF